MRTPRTHFWTEAEVDAHYELVRVNWIQGHTTLGDNIRGTNKSEFIDGCGGSDTIRAGGGNDMIVSGEEADTIYTGSGRDLIITTSTGDARFGDKVMDFKHGQDVIVFGEGGGGVDSFDDLLLTSIPRGVEITIPGTDYLMTVLGVSTLSASDFCFI